MKKNIARRTQERKARSRRLRDAERRIERRLQVAQEQRAVRGFSGKGPVFNDGNLKYEVASKVRGIAHGGAPLILKLAQQVGLPDFINANLQLLKYKLPYHESDHVLNLALNALCEGTCLQDIELRRNDENFLNALGVDAIPDPTTAGDFCRRFSAADVGKLMDAINQARLNVWRQQPPEFFEEAVIDCDGTFVLTKGECKQGMDITYKGKWGYHPLLVSIANTQEPLFIVNRSGNQTSEDGAAQWSDKAIALCREAGFKRVRLRGDTAFSQTQFLDGWDAQNVLFQFGFKAFANLEDMAENLSDSEWSKLHRPDKYTVRTEPRRKPENVKRRIIREREYLNLELQSEEVAEFDYQPTACKKSYRMVVVRKHISREQGEKVLLPEVRYLFYITNDRELSKEEIVFGCNHRCDQENLISHLASGVRCLSAPVDNLESNWAYMVSVSIAWSLKAWAALLLPTPKPATTQKPTTATEPAERRRWLRMEFGTWAASVLRLPCQIVKQARRIICRVLCWTAELEYVFHLSDVIESGTLRASATLPGRKSSVLLE